MLGTLENFQTPPETTKRSDAVPHNLFHLFFFFPPKCRPPFLQNALDAL